MCRTQLRESQKIRAAIIDLDDTLYDCYGQRVLASHRYASQAMVRAGLKAGVEEVLRARMAALKCNPRLDYIDNEVCRLFRASNTEEIISAARAAYFTLPVTHLTLFPDSLRVLKVLKSKGTRVFVVTSGNQDTQRAKVSALGLDQEQSVDGIYYIEDMEKEDVFSAIRVAAGAEPAEVLVIGDRPDEIRAGNRLGMRTIRVRHGEFSSLEAASQEEEPTYEVGNIGQVLDLPLFS